MTSFATVATSSCRVAAALCFLTAGAALASPASGDPRLASPASQDTLPPDAILTEPPASGTDMPSAVVHAQAPVEQKPGYSEAINSPTPHRGPYYVDFRARTASSYGHAFMWYGKSTEREIDIAGLHPATDSVVPYVVGHVAPVLSETGASYGDLDEQYLLAQYRVYLSAEDAPKVFAYIKHLQKTTPFWHATTMNCTWFIGRVANFMGLKAPSHLMVPEDYVNELRKINNGRELAVLPPKSRQASY